MRRDPREARDTPSPAEPSVHPTPGGSDGSDRVLALVLAHPDGTGLGRTIRSLLAQTCPPDRIVVLADGRTDRAERIARRFDAVTVMRIVGNTEGDTGALNHGWRRWQAGADLVATIETGAVLAADCLEMLIEDLGRSSHVGGVLVRDTVDDVLGSSRPVRLLLTVFGPGQLSARHAVLERRRPTTALGGRVALFDAVALRAVADANETRGPWDPSARAAHVRLICDLAEIGRRATVSHAARAHTGPRLTIRSLGAGPVERRRSPS
jgi:hypothetical protein